MMRFLALGSPRRSVGRFTSALVGRKGLPQSSLREVIEYARATDLAAKPAWEAWWSTAGSVFLRPQARPRRWSTVSGRRH